MDLGSIGARPHAASAETRWRHRFTWLTVAVTVALISWGGFVTSINAGMAVPDWPATFGSYDPFRTGLAQWWTQTPVLAEHGHRLLGALVGILTVILAGWTWLKDPRRWMRNLGLGVLALVIIQGVLGGVRVTENSITLAMVHACTAQIFFSMLVAMALFTSRSWLEARDTLPDADRTTAFRRLAIATAGVLYLQIVFGALLRHLGHGIDGAFAAIHISGAFVVTGFVFATFVYVHKYFADNSLLNRWGWILIWTLGAQFALGLAAYLVLLNEMAQAIRTSVQIVLTAGHLVVGALLMASAVALTLIALRRPADQTADLPGDATAREPVPSDRLSVPAE